MKHLRTFLSFILYLAITIFSSDVVFSQNDSTDNWKFSKSYKNISKHFKETSPSENKNFEMFSGMAFGPDGLLFFSSGGVPIDSFRTSTGIFCLDTEDRIADEKNPIKNYKLKYFTKTIDLNTAIQKIEESEKINKLLVTDAVVNPSSGKIYITVLMATAERQSTGLYVVDHNGTISTFTHEDKSYAYFDGPNEKDHKVHSFVYHNGKLIVNGTSTAGQFSSMTYIIDPELKDNNLLNVCRTKLFHNNHGDIWETNAPIRCTAVFKENGKDMIAFSTSCTAFGKMSLEGGVYSKKEINAITVSELGPGNHPQDMVSYLVNGKPTILITNSKYGPLLVTNKVLTRNDAGDINDNSYRRKSSDKIIKKVKLKGPGNPSRIDLLGDKKLVVIFSEGAAWQSGKFHLKICDLP